MRKSGVSRGSGRKQRQPDPADLSGTVEGQIAEICQDLAEQAKRMQRLQEQAQELRATLRLWAGLSGSDVSLRGPASREGRR